MSSIAALLPRCMSYGGAGPAIRRNIERGQEADARARLQARIQRLEAQVRALGHEPVE